MCWIKDTVTKGEGKIVTVKTMKTVSWIGGKAPFILNLSTLWCSVVSFTSWPNFSSEKELSLSNLSLLKPWRQWAGLEVKLHSFLISVLYDVQWSASRPGQFFLRKGAECIHWIETVLYKIYILTQRAVFECIFLYIYVLLFIEPNGDVSPKYNWIESWLGPRMGLNLLTKINISRNKVFVYMTWRHMGKWMYSSAFYDHCIIRQSF